MLVLLNPGVLCLDRPFEVIPNIGGGHTTRRAFDPFSISIIDEIGSRSPAHRRQAVLNVIRQVESAAANDARYLVAIAIVNIVITSGRRDGVRDGVVPPGAGDRSAVGVAHPGFACQVAG